MATSSNNPAPASSENGDKLQLSEWPSLSDVCTNVNKNQNGKKSSTDAKRNASKDNSTEDCDSSKENEENLPNKSAGSGRRGGRKKDRRLKWNPVEEPVFCAVEPYRKKYTRPAYDNDSENSNCDLKGQVPRGGGRPRIPRRGARGSHHFRGHREASSSCDDTRSPPGEVVEQVPTPEFTGPIVYMPYQQVSTSTSISGEDETCAQIRHQIEYYFSVENLLKDMYMRHNMDELGYMKIELIANFPKIIKMKVPLEKVIEAIERSDKLEVFDRCMVRPIIDPLKWPILTYDVAIPSPEAAPQPTALRPDVPDFVPGQPYMFSNLVEDMASLNFYSPFEAHSSAFYFPNSFMEPLHAGTAT